MGDLAAGFHFQPTELWDMDVDELVFWHDELRRIHK